jgi:hypothetical protein
LEERRALPPPWRGALQPWSIGDGLLQGGLLWILCFVFPAGVAVSGKRFVETKAISKTYALLVFATTKPGNVQKFLNFFPAFMQD